MLVVKRLKVKKSSNVLSKILLTIFNFHFLHFSVLFLYRLQAQLSFCGQTQEKWRCFIGYVLVFLCLGLFSEISCFFPFAVHGNPLVLTDLKMFCLNYLVFSCIYSFSIKWSNSMPFFCTNKQYFCQTFFLTDWPNMS